MTWPERKEEGVARALPRSSRASCVEAGLYRALFTTGSTDKDQSEQ